MSALLDIVSASVSLFNQILILYTTRIEVNGLMDGWNKPIPWIGNSNQKINKIKISYFKKYKQHTVVIAP